MCPTASYLHLPPEMDHNGFRLVEALAAPFRQFITQLEAPQRNTSITYKDPDLPSVSGQGQEENKQESDNKDKDNDNSDNTTQN